MTVIRRMEGEAIAKKMCEDTMSRESFQQLKMYMMGCPDHLKIRTVGICCHTTDEFLTDRGIHPIFRAGNYDRKLYRRRKRQCLYMLMMKELEVTVWKETYTLPDDNGADNRFDTPGPQNLWVD